MENITLIDPSKNHGNVTKLKPYTTYMLTVSVITEHNANSLMSDPLFNTTLEGVPEVPQNVIILERTNNSISIKWDAPKEMNGVLRDYQLSYVAGDVRLDRPITTKERTYKFTQLKSYTQYNFSISACTMQCSESAMISTSTLISQPGVMQQPIIKFRNATILKFYWERPKNAGGRLNFYQLQIKENAGNQNTTTIVNETSMFLIVNNRKN